MPEFANQLHDAGVLIQAQNVTWNGAAPNAGSGKWPVKALPPLITPDHPIIGRTQLVEQVVQAFEEGRRSVVLLHLPGVGKTTMAALLAGDRRVQQRFPDGVLWTNVGADPRQILPALRRWAAALAVCEQRMKDCGHDVSQWRDAIVEAIGDRRLLLVIDNVWDLGTGNTFALGGPGCAHLFTTRKRSVAVRLSKARFDVGALSVSDGFALLQAFAPEAARMDPDAVKDLVRAVGGLPLALELMGHQLACAGELMQNQRIELELAHLADVKRRLGLQKPGERPDEAVSLASVIETSYQMLGPDRFEFDGLPGDVLRRALQSLSILQSDICFDLELAQRVTGLDREAAYAALNGLADAGLIEVSVAAPPERPPLAAPQEDTDEPGAAATRESYSIHPTIAEYIREQKVQPGELQRLHLAAAAYYSGRLTALEHAYQLEPQGYERWYLYEQREWQSAKEGWLYHLARADERRQMMIAFLRTWFDGFWWWGVFLDFEFCEQLLHEWGQRKLVPEAQHGLRVLKQFMAAYPKESEPRSGNWKKVERLLEEVRSGAGLNGPDDTLDADSRHVRGLTSIFLAEARRFGKPQDLPGARAFYLDALDQFEETGDDWNIAWVLYHLADMLTEAGQGDEAARLCERALRLRETEKDPEVQANLQRVLGDVARQRGDSSEAAVRYHEAVRQAYRFQVDPQLPDAYTIRFYTQMAELVAQRLIALRHDHEAEALSISRRLHDAWHRGEPDAEAASVLAQDEATSLAGWMFLPGAPAGLLEAGDLQAKARYADSVKAHMAELRPL